MPPLQKKSILHLKVATFSTMLGVICYSSAARFTRKEAVLRLEKLLLRVLREQNTSNQTWKKLYTVQCRLGKTIITAVLYGDIWACTVHHLRIGELVTQPTIEPKRSQFNKTFQNKI